MADKVQKQLEDFVPDLQELLSQDLFSQNEIKKIIEKRREFEFDIISPDPNISLDSYKKYIKYELELDKLIESRYRKIKKSNNTKSIGSNGISNGVNGNIKTYNNGINKKKLRVDINSKRFIHRLFRRCLNRFISNIEVYNLYLSFCKQIKAFKLFERVIMNGLSKNPNDHGLWLILGSYILKNRGIIASKNIIQRSLRIIPNNLNLILFLFQLEIKSLLEIANNYRDDKDALSGTVNKFYIIFEYGYNNLSNEDLIVFYFSVLSLLNQLFDLNIVNDELDKLLDKINTMVDDKNIPIIKLYRYQIKLLEELISNSKANFTSTTQMFNDSDKGLLILMLQFIHNLISRPTDLSDNNRRDFEIIIDVNPDSNGNDTLNNSSDNADATNITTILINTDKEYIINNYCIIENIYYICLLGNMPDYYDIKSCKYTSNLANYDQIERLNGLFSNYFNTKLKDILKLLLDLNPEDAHQIYYHLKLLADLSGNSDFRDEVVGKISEILVKLSTFKDLTNIHDELVHTIIKLDIDFELKLKVFNNFKSLRLNNFRYFIDELLNVKLENNEKIALFLLFFRDNDEYYWLKHFLNKFDDLDGFNQFVTETSNYLNATIFNHIIAFTTDNLEATIDDLAGSNDIEGLRLAKCVNTLNGLIFNKHLEVTNKNKQLLDNMNVKLSLFNLSIKY